MAQMMTLAEKQKILNQTIGGLNKKFGPNTVSRMSDVEEELSLKYIKSPSLEFNTMLGGGLVQGRIVELYGEYSSGKTSMALEIIAYNQKLNPDFVAGWFETEESMDPDYLKMFGIDPTRFMYWDQRAMSAEQGLETLRGLIASGTLNMIVCNSVAGLMPSKESEDDLEKQGVALTARLMSKLMRVIVGSSAKTGTTVVFINQLRTNIGVMYGDTSTTTGGRALSFYATQRVGMRKNKIQQTDPITDEEGIKVCCRTAKNRAARDNPFKSSYYYARFGLGIDGDVEIPDAMHREGLLRRAGAYQYIEDENGTVRVIAGVECKFKSKNAMIDAIRENPSLKAELVRMYEDYLQSGSAIGTSQTEEEIKEVLAVQDALEKEFGTEEVAQVS